MEKNKYQHMLNVVEMRWTIIGGVKVKSQGDVGPKMKEMTCAQIKSNFWH